MTEVQEFTSGPDTSGDKEFTSQTKPVTFKIDGERMTAAPEIPADTMLDLMDAREVVAQSGGARQRVQVLLDAMENVLYPESMERVRQRMGSTTEPLGLKTVLEIVEWLIGEAYGLRPTRSLQDSEAGSGSTGESSTDGAPAETSSPDASAGIASSTSSTTGSSETIPG